MLNSFTNLSMYDYDTIMKSLALHDDEPDYKSELFEFNKYKEQMSKIIDNILDIDKPFALCLNGEWGSGKTSLMRRVYEGFEKRSSDQLKVIWFDAWKYERLDPVLALLQRIISEYDTNSKLKSIFNGLLSLTADIASRKLLDLPWNDVKKHFRNTVETLNYGLNKVIEETIGNGKLLVFIDDLDRCHIDNIIGMLEAIKILFNAKNAKFIVAVDIKKLERAWALKHNNDANAIEEGKDHLDKIFQLRLNLPRKSDEEMYDYINKIAEKFPSDLRDIVNAGCSANPRKIKRWINALSVSSYILSEDNIEKLLLPLVIWSIISINFPKIVELVKLAPNQLFDMYIIKFDWHEITNMRKLYNSSDNIQLINYIISLEEEKQIFDKNRTALGIREVSKRLTPLSVYVMNDYDLYELIKKIESYINSKNVNREELVDNLQHIINNTKLFL